MLFPKCLKPPILIGNLCALLRCFYVCKCTNNFEKSKLLREFFVIFCVCHKKTGQHPLLFIDVALSGRRLWNRFLPKALPLGWDMKGFQPFAVVFKSRFYQHFVPNGTF